MAKKKATINVSKQKTKSSKGKAKKKDLFGSFIDLPDDLAERGREIWLAGLGALSTVEEQGARLFSSLVEKGEAWEKEGRKQLGAAKKTLDAAREKVEATVGEAAKTGKVTELDDKAFAMVEASVERVLHRLGVPTRAEVKDLAGKVEKLSAQVTTLATVIERGHNGEAPAAQSAAARVVYHLVPHEDGWAVKQEGHAEPLAVHATKAETLDAARDIAREHAPSRLVTHKKDGKVQESATYDA